MFSKESITLLLMLTIMLFFPALYSMGISVVVMELFLIFLSFIFLAQIRFFKVNLICTLFFLLVLIDKTNDLLYEVSLTNIGPIIYAVCITIVFNNIKGKTEKDFLRIFPALLLIATIFNIVYCITLGSAPLRSLDRDVSAMLMLYSMLNFYYGKYKWPVMLLSIIICVVVLEARTMVLSYGVFFVGYYLFKKHSRVKLKKAGLILEFLFSLFVIYLGIQTEMLLGPSGSEGGVDFSGRGYLWGAALSTFFSGSITNIIFGMPSNPGNLNHLFGYDMFEYDSLNESIGKLLTAGNFHNTVVYYIFNTGVVGTFILFSIFYKALKRFGFNNENYNIFNALFLVALFNGKSITGIYIISTMLMFILFIKLPSPRDRSFNNTIYDNSR